MHIQRISIKVDRKHQNRYLATVSLVQISEALGEPVTVLYTNNMDPGAVAGNHFHKLKREAFRAAHGRFEIALVDVDTGERHTFLLDSDPESPDHACIIVPQGFAHAVRNVGRAVARLDVFATDEPRKPADDFSYDVLS
jgi:dTDP-4-dehydrorhamnose 3,5-epimerase-like enzyme